MRNKYGPFPGGVDNRRARTDLSSVRDNRPTDFLSDAQNIDLVDGGHIRRRDGYAKAVDGSFHSLWGDGGQFGYAVSGTQMLVIDRNRTATQLQGGMAFGMPVAYARHNGLVFWSDGLRVGAVDGAAALAPAALPMAPAVRATDGGALLPGQYQLVFSLVGPLGEGPATEPVAVDVQADGAIHLSGIQAPAGQQLLVYMTAPDGSVFSRADYVQFEGEARIATMADSGAAPQTVGLVGLPAGRILCSHHSRLLSVRENVLSYSAPFAPLLADPVSNFIAFEAPITVVMSCGNGLFVCADKTYWLAGDISQASRDEVLPYGAVFGSGTKSPNAPSIAFWMSTRGLVRGSADGSAVNVQEARLSLSGGRQATTYVRERNGQSHVIAALKSPAATRGAISTSIDCEVVRRS